MEKIKYPHQALLMFFFFTSLNYSLKAQITTKIETDSLIQLGIELSIQHHYTKAESIFQQLIENYPGHPVGYFFMAATIQSKMIDFETDQWEREFQNYIQLTIHYAKKNQINRLENEVWSMFYQGSALCYLAFYEGRKKEYLAAINHGLSGISILKKIIKSHPDFYDVYFGIGSYKYWRSQITRYLNWLPLISDKRQEGMDMVRQAVENGKYTRFAAMNELIWILLDAKRPGEAYAWAINGLEKFPQSRFFLWGAAKSAFALEQYSDAALYFQQLLLSIVDAPVDNNYNEYICRVKLAQCFDKLGRPSDAAAQIEIVQSLPLSPEIKTKLKKQQTQLNQLKKKLSLIPKNEFANK